MGYIVPQLLQFVSTDTQPVECTIFNITWIGGTPPFSLQIRAQDYVLTETELFIVDQFFAWVVDFPAGKLLEFTLVDDTRLHAATTERLEVQPNIDNSCVRSVAEEPTTTSISSSSSTSTTISTQSESTTTTSTALEVPTSTSSRTTTSSPSTPTSADSSTSTSASTSSPSPLVFTPSGSSSTTAEGTYSAQIPSSTSSFAPSPSAHANAPPVRAALSKGAIVGIAIGAAALLVLASILLCWIRRRKTPIEPMGRRADGNASTLMSVEPQRLAKAHMPMTERDRLDPSPFSIPVSALGTSTPVGVVPSRSATPTAASIPALDIGVGESARSVAAEPSSASSSVVSVAAHPPVPKLRNWAGSDRVPESLRMTKDGRDSPVPASSSALARGVADRDQSKGNRLQIPSALSDDIPVAVRSVPPEPRVEIDGGIRLAGGPADEVPEADDIAGMETLPPPYQRY
ncbi:hypothetical protein C8Q76DRAFT_695725 [Earliella scabrosa]|nr:hypothetical protein C8Q76DRAFT_695725 [Earliella scabrosa]